MDTTRYVGSLRTEGRGRGQPHARPLEGINHVCVRGGHRPNAGINDVCVGRSVERWGFKVAGFRFRVSSTN